MYVCMYVLYMYVFEILQSTGKCRTYQKYVCMYVCTFVSLYIMHRIFLSDASSLFVIFLFLANNKDGVDSFIPIDILVALHACDTATDEAIYCGVRTGAAVIVTAPCCQKEVRAQMDSFLSAKNVKL